MAHTETLLNHFSFDGAPQFYRCEPDWHWHVDRLLNHDLWCVLAGSGEINVNGSTSPLLPGSCWLLEPGSRVRAGQNAVDRLRVFAVHFTPLEPDASPRRLTPEERPADGLQVRDLAMLEALCRGCVESHRRGDQLGSTQALLYLRQILYLLIEETQTDAAGPSDPRITRAQQAILEEPGRAWSVAQMARSANLSRSQFTRLFKSATGRAPMQCVLESRIHRARQLLNETCLAVGEIADTLGYADIYHFSRQFKAAVGVPPSQFRAASRRKGGAGST